MSRCFSEQVDASRKNQFVMPGLIMLTFVMFYAIPFACYCASKAVQSGDQPLIEANAKLAMKFGMLLDPIIYVLLVRRYRNVIAHRFISSCKRRDDVHNREPTVSTVNSCSR